MDELIADEGMYRVRLPIFEGPLDLLLYLVKKNEYDIFDIPIAEITRQYMDHIEIMKVLNLDVAGEYLVMAATLAHIKSKMLLPPDRTEDQEEEELDPRMELALQLAEYERFKDAARQLDEFDILLRDVFLRGGKMVLEVEDEKLADLTLFGLVAALQKVLLAAPKETIHQISVGRADDSGKDGRALPADNRAGGDGIRRALCRGTLAYDDRRHLPGTAGIDKVPDRAYLPGTALRDNPPLQGGERGRLTPWKKRNSLESSRR